MTRAFMRREKYASRPVKKMYNVLARYTNSDASTIVRSVTGTGWSESLGKIPCKTTAEEHWE